MIILKILIGVVFFSFANAEPVKKNEAYYQKKLCDSLNGKMEFVLDDRSRVDCLTSDYAIEVDFEKKPYECAAQALYYSIKTGKKPACALITSEKTSREITRLETLAAVYNIKIIFIER